MKTPALRLTQEEVARAAAVSASTVSRVLNNSMLVETRTRERVLKVIRDLGYVPSAAARNLSRQCTDTIGVVLHQMSTGFFASVMSGIDNAARDGGYHILSALCRDTEDERDTCYAMFDSSRVDGLIVLDSALSEKTIARLKKYPQPFVLIEREPDDPDICTVSVENRKGAYEGMKHLLSLGYDNILVLHGRPGAQDAALRLDGCRDALAECARPAMTCHFADGAMQTERALKAFGEHCAMNGFPCAVFALNDTMAIAILKEVRRRGLRVPDDVAVVGFDGIDSAEHLELTSVELPMAELGVEALRLLLRQLANPMQKAEQVRLKTRLVVRETCGSRRRGKSAS